MTLQERQDKERKACRKIRTMPVLITISSYGKKIGPLTPIQSRQKAELQRLDKIIEDKVRSGQDCEEETEKWFSIYKDPKTYFEKIDKE